MRQYWHAYLDTLANALLQPYNAVCLNTFSRHATSRSQPYTVCRMSSGCPSNLNAQQPSPPTYVDSLIWFTDRQSHTQPKFSLQLLDQMAAAPNMLNKAANWGVLMAFKQTHCDPNTVQACICQLAAAVQGLTCCTPSKVQSCETPHIQCTPLLPRRLPLPGPVSALVA
jgi:hypothetical protein